MPVWHYTRNSSTGEKNKKKIKHRTLGHILHRLITGLVLGVFLVRCGWLKKPTINFELMFMNALQEEEQEDKVQKYTTLHDLWPGRA